MSSGMTSHRDEQVLEPGVHCIHGGMAARGHQLKQGPTGCSTRQRYLQIVDSIPPKASLCVQPRAGGIIKAETQLTC